MSGEQSYILHLLRMLESSLLSSDRSAESAALGKIIDRVASADSLDDALAALYAVEGWDAFAMRLMWYARRVEEFPDEVENGALREYRVAEIRPLLGPIHTEEPAAEQASTVPEALSDALKNFGYIIEELKSRSFAGEAFVRLDGSLLEMTLSEADRLRHAGDDARHDEVVRFADAFGLFVRYVLERETFYDVRAINLIDTATTTLQSILHPSGPEERDSLLQTIDLLENPIAVLE